MFCWAFAKKMGGHFALRIEDTDAARSSDESAKGIMEDLAWLGLHWDEGPELRTPAGVIGGDPRGVGPFFQARRVKSHYDPHIMKLVEMGKAYPAFESNELIDAERKKAVAAKQTYRYDRASYAKVPDIKERIRLIELGESHVIRFFAPAEEVIVHDQVLGDVKISPGELDDFVIRKGDGFPTYHFAVVVDDETMGVTHVMRAQEHLYNTPRHVALQKAFGFASPVYAHMPLIFNMDATKMSKRDKAKAARKALKDALAKSGGGLGDELVAKLGVERAAVQGFLDAENDRLDIAERIAKHFKIALPEIEVADFRDAGYTPEAICNFLGLLGWNPGMKLADGKDLEKFDLAFLAKNFSIERIGKTNSKFDRAKLLSFNADDIARMDTREFAMRFHAWMSEHEPATLAALGGDAQGDAFKLFAKTIQPRAKTFREGAKAATFVTLDDAGVVFDTGAVEKHLKANSSQGLVLLARFRELLAGLTSFDAGSVHTLLEQFVKDNALANPGPIAQAIRVAIAGVAVSPGIGETLAILGRQRTLTRIDRCLAVHGG
jgi:glutamyl/glutaminyl-tRNA synthetase